MKLPGGNTCELNSDILQTQREKMAQARKKKWKEKQKKGK